MRALLLGLLFACCLPTSAAAARPVKVNIDWEYKNFSSTVEVFDVKGRPRLWETRSVKEIKDAPLADRVEGASFTLEPGQRKRFAIVVRNESDEPLFFFASPHAVHPVEHSLGFKFKCLCINHAFTVGPGESWYRIVEFRLSRNFTGRELTVTHSIIGIDGEWAESFLKKPALPDY